MRFIRKSLQLLVLVTLLCTISCVFNSDSEIVHYTDRIDLGFPISQIITNECIRYGVWIQSYPDDENFFLIESREHLDTLEVYYEHDWIPRLEELLPENGMLLLFQQQTWYEVDYIKHYSKLYGTTVYVDLVIEEFDVDNPVPGVREFTVPIGIVPED